MKGTDVGTEHLDRKCYMVQWPSDHHEGKRDVAYTHMSMYTHSHAIITDQVYIYKHVLDMLELVCIGWTCSMFEQYVKNTIKNYDFNYSV
jgi:hypothetical protein